MMTIKARFMRTLLVMGCLFLRSPAATEALDWNHAAILAAASGQAADTVSTIRFLRNGRGCTEANPHFGPHPSTRALVLSSVAVTGGVIVLLHITEHTPTRWLGRSVAIFAGGYGAYHGVRNIWMCGI